MAVKKGAQPLSEAQLVANVTARLDNGFSQRDVREVVRALKDEMIESVQGGRKVTLTGLLAITPSAKAGRKKGTVVKNPLMGTERILKADEPDKFVVKARASTAIVKGFPTLRSAAGQKLIAQLKPAKRKGK